MASITKEQAVKELNAEIDFSVQVGAGMTNLQVREYVEGVAASYHRLRKLGKRVDTMGDARIRVEACETVVKQRGLAR